MRTQSSIVQSLQSLASLPTETLEALSVAHLRKSLRTVGVSQVEINGETLPVSKAKKSELITAIIEITTPTKTLQTLELTEVTEEDLQQTVGRLEFIHASVAAYAEHLYKELREYVLSLWDSSTGTWAMPSRYPEQLSLELYLWLEQYKVTTGDLLDDSTKVVYASRIRNTVKRLMSVDKSQPYYEQLLRAYNAFKVHNHARFKEHSEHKRTVQKQRAEVRYSNSQQIDPTAVLNHAIEVINKAATGGKVRWHDVSVALTLVTGRRPSEIHSSASFTRVDEYRVSFSGQLKKKDIDFSAYEIPVLAPATNVVKAHQWLKAQGKFWQGNPDEAHKKVSNEISKTTIKSWYHDYLPTVEDLEVDGKTYRVRTHYRMREIYALIALRNHEQSSERHLSASDKVRYIASILGHEENSKAYEAYDANFYLA